MTETTATEDRDIVYTMEDATTAADGPGSSQHDSSALGRSSHHRRRSGMESSVLRFKDVHFVVGSGDKQKHILQNVSGKVQWGRTYSTCSRQPTGVVCRSMHSVVYVDTYARFLTFCSLPFCIGACAPLPCLPDVLAIMGPSGAGVRLLSLSHVGRSVDWHTSSTY